MLLYARITAEVHTFSELIRKEHVAVTFHFGIILVIIKYRVFL